MDSNTGWTITGVAFAAMLCFACKGCVSYNQLSWEHEQEMAKLGYVQVKKDMPIRWQSQTVWAKAEDLDNFASYEGIDLGE